MDVGGAETDEGGESDGGGEGGGDGADSAVVEVGSSEGSACCWTFLRVIH